MSCCLVCSEYSKKRKQLIPGEGPAADERYKELSF